MPTKITTQYDAFVSILEAALDEALKLQMAEVHRLQADFRAQQRQTTPISPSKLLKEKNAKGYDLQQCLFTTAKMWAEGNSKFPVDKVLPRQANDFKVELTDIFEAIKSDRRLHGKFMQYPACGYGDWYLMEDEDVPF